MTALSHHTVAQVESTLCALETILTGTELEAQLRQFCGELGFGFFIYRRESYGNGRKIHSKAHARDQLPRCMAYKISQAKLPSTRSRSHGRARSRAPFFWGSAEYLRQLPSLPRRLF